MGKTLGELQRGKSKVPRGQQRKTKPTPFSRNSEHRIVQYGRPSSEGSSNRRKTGQGGCSRAPSSCSIDAPGDTEDKRLVPGFLGECREEDESTPSLANMDEDEDTDDDMIGFENITDCLGSMTSLETSEMIKSFDLYMQQKHRHDCDINSKRMIATDDTGGKSSCATSGNTTNNAQTPVEPWSLRKFMQGRSTSESVDGIHLKYGFEPDLYTLDGIRKELFFGKSW